MIFGKKEIHGNNQHFKQGPGTQTPWGGRFKYEQ